MVSSEVTKPKASQKNSRSSGGTAKKQPPFPAALQKKSRRFRRL
jgi:hypothetical protein